MTTAMLQAETGPKLSLHASLSVPKTCVDWSALGPRGQLTAAACREPEEMHATFEGISMQFGAISALAGIPQV